MKSILIVEDSITQLKVLAKVLKDESYDVVESINGKDALEKLKTNKDIGLIISDIVMPEMDGFELCFEVKKDTNFKHIPVILLTQLSKTTDVIQALNVGADSFLTKPYSVASLYQRIKNVLQTAKSIDEKTFFIGDQILEVTDTSTAPKLLISTFTDAQSKYKELQETKKIVDKKNEELEVSIKQKNQILGIAAHDLRSPINAILGLSNILIEDLEELDKEELVHMLTIIRDRSLFMNTLLSETLDFSAIESGDLKLKKETKSLKKFIDTIIANIKMTLHKRDIELKFTCHDDLEYQIDPIKFEQVMTNLIGNGIKYSPDNTEITIELKKVDSKALISVTDQGQGIKEAELEKLFEPFKVTSNKSVDGSKSTGLGLVISKKIVEAHDGQLSVTSEYGKGSTFALELPL